MNPFEEQVRTRAYHMWIAEGRVSGRADAHWLRAEGEIQAQSSAAPVLVHAAAQDLTLLPSPAQVLDKPLKTKTGRAKAVAKAEILPEATRQVATKPVAATKPASKKAAAEKAVSKTAAKTSDTTIADTKAADTKATSKPAAAKPVRSRAARTAPAADATVH